MALTKATLTGAKDTILAAWTKFNDLIDDLLATTSGLGASQIGIEDSGSNMAADNVEDALAEIYADVANPRTAYDVLDESADNVAASTTWTFLGGLVRFDNVVTTVTGATVNLSGGNVKHYVEVNSSGTVSANTTAFTKGRIPVREITVTAGAQAVSTDKRAWFQQGLVLIDDDGDTQVQVEESSDEDTIRFDCAGGEQVVITDGAITPTLDDDISLGTTALAFKEINLMSDGLHLKSANDADFDLVVTVGSNLSADRALTITTGDAARTVTLNENFTIGDGTNITITGVTAARTITLNENLTIGDGTDITITGVTAARTLTMNENLTVGGGTDVTITAEDAAGTLTLDNCSLEVEDGVGSGNTVKFVIATDDASRIVTLSENLTIGDGTDITITGVTAARTITLNENLTVGGGTDITITAEDAAGTLTLDNCNLEVEDEVGTGNTIKFAIATDDASRTVTLSENLTIGDGNAGTITFTGASKTLSVEDTSIVNQDLTSDATVAFQTVTASANNLSYVISAISDGNSVNYGAYSAQAGQDNPTGSNIMLGCFDGDGDYHGAIVINNSTVEFAQVAPEADKINITDSSLTGVGIVKQLKVRNYEGKKSIGYPQDGFVCEEVAEDYPPASAITNGELSILPMRFIPLLTKAVQELASRIEELESV